MAILTTRPRGTNDFLPAETPRWQYVERTLLSTAAPKCGPFIEI